MTTLAPALRRAARFLIEGQDADGGWRDFDLRAGVSTSWTTAYVATRLAAVADLDARAPAAVEAAARFLERHREAAGGWAYNSRCMADADSTALALIFLTGHDPRRWLKDAAVLASFQRPCGGFATYRHLPDTHPWAAANAEVTPTALRALALFLPATHSILQRGRAWLTRSGGAHRGYWWTTPAYAALERARIGLPAGDAPIVGPADADVFSVALDLERATLAPSAPADVDQAADRLIRRQLADGSWPSAPILRVPDLAAEPGSPAARGGSANADLRRLFTTATALAAINAVRTVWARPATLRTQNDRASVRSCESPVSQLIE